jgi:hypothetical protein
LPKRADCRSRWLGHGALPCCAGDDVEAESASLRVDRPVYPRRVELITQAEGGNRQLADSRPPKPCPIGLPRPTPRRSPEPMEERGDAHRGWSAKTPGNWAASPPWQIASSPGGPHHRSDCVSGLVPHSAPQARAGGQPTSEEHRTRFRSIRLCLPLRQPRLA